MTSVTLNIMVFCSSSICFDGSDEPLSGYCCGSSLAWVLAAAIALLMPYGVILRPVRRERLQNQAKIR
jgi:hypothetical protein